MKIFFAAAAMICAVGAFAAVNPRLDEVLSTLDLDRPEFKGVREAATPQAKQDALVAAFKARKVIPMYEKIPPLNSTLRTYADDAVAHRFLGQPVYPVQYRGEEIDWDTNPFPDNEWLWQFHRFRWHRGLGSAWQHTRDEKYTKEWSYEINHWVNHMHDPARYRRHPGWRSLEVALRLQVLSETFELFLDAPQCDGETLVNFLYTLPKHVDILQRCYPKEVVKKDVGNWDIFHMEALLCYAAAFPEFRNREAVADFVIQKLVYFQELALLPDGVINEYIPSYHAAYPPQFLRFADLCRKHGFKAEFPQSYFERIEKAIAAVMYWSHPDATPPLFGDAWLRKPGSERNYLKRFYERYPERKDFLAFVTAGKEGKYPDLRNYDLPNAGYYMLRSGWEKDDLFLVLKNTRAFRKKGHNQTDNMTFELSAYGRRFMTDSGCYNYSGEPQWRRWFRLPRAHQMVSLNDQEVTEKNARMIARSSSKVAESVVLEYDPANDWTHRRMVSMVDDKFFVLIDCISGKAAGTLRQHFQFMPGAWLMDAGRLTARTMYGDDANLIVKSAAVGGNLSLTEEEGWYSPIYMHKEPRPAFAFVREKAADETVYFATLLLPTKKTEQNWSASLQPAATNGVVTLQINLDLEHNYTLILNPDGNVAVRKEKATGKEGSGW